MKTLLALVPAWLVLSAVPLLAECVHTYTENPAVKAGKSVSGEKWSPAKPVSPVSKKK